MTIESYETRPAGYSIGLGARVHFKTNEAPGSPVGGTDRFCTIKKSGDVVELVLAPVSGEIYRIEVFSLIAKKFFDDNTPDTRRFRSRKLRQRAAAKAGESPTSGSAWRDAEPYDVWYKLASTVITAEVAKAFEDADAIRKSLWSHLEVTEVSPNELVVSISNATDNAARPWAFPLAKRASVNRQLWNWSGRTYSTSIAELVEQATIISAAERFAHQPTMEPTGNWEAFVENDGQWFGDRADYDSILVSGNLQPPPGANNDKPEKASALLSGPQHKIELDRDRRAQYWRHSAMIESRYIGLMQEEARTKESAQVRAPWRRLLVKAHPAERMPPPRLRFILPLTQPMPTHKDREIDVADHALSTLLVVLEEQWGEMAGIAEKLEAEVVEWRDPSVQDPGPSQLREIGFDPIIPAKPFPDQSNGKAVEVVSQSPLGLVFDARVERPRPASTCFELRLTRATAEKLKSMPQQDIMAKVRLRRDMFTKLTQSAGDFASEWTTPEWVIFNADSRKWKVKGGATVNYGELRLSQDLEIKLVRAASSSYLWSTTLKARWTGGSSSC